MALEEPSSETPVPPQRGQLVSTLCTTQFAWFAGHVITLVAGLLYLVTFWRAKVVLYMLAFTGATFSFGIVFFNDVVKAKRFHAASALASDDNVHYFAIATFWLLYAPITSLALVPFVLFSFFHVLTYTRSNLVEYLANGPAVSERIFLFVREYNDKSLEVAAWFELVLLAWLGLRALAFRPKALVTAGVFAGFIKVRYDNSVFTRRVVKGWEFQGDVLVARFDPRVKGVWLATKRVVRRVCGASNAKHA